MGSKEKEQKKKGVEDKEGENSVYLLIGSSLLRRRRFGGLICDLEGSR